MKRKILVIAILIFLFPAFCFSKQRAAKALSAGTTTDLDSRTGMSDGDAAYVYYLTGTASYHLDYTWDSDSAVTESIPWVVDADAAGNGRWLLTAEHYKYISIGIESPTSSENFGGVYFEKAAKIYKVVGVMRGTSPSVTFNVQHNTDRSNTTTGDVFTADKACTSTTTGDIWTGTDLDGDITIAAGEYLWLTTSATGGTTNTAIMITIVFSYYWGS